MFDWDRDYEALVSGKAAGSDPCQTGHRSLHQYVSDIGQMWFRACLFASALILSLLVPHEVGQASQATLVLATDPASVSVMPALAETLPDDLLVYDQGQAHTFLAGLRSASDADLLRYLRHAQLDLQMAGSGMVAVLHDALRLAEHEAARRGLTTPPPAVSGQPGGVFAP